MPSLALLTFGDWFPSFAHEMLQHAESTPVILCRVIHYICTGSSRRTFCTPCQDIHRMADTLTLSSTQILRQEQVVDKTPGDSVFVQRVLLALSSKMPVPLKLLCQLRKCQRPFCWGQAQCLCVRECVCTSHNNGSFTSPIHSLIRTGMKQQQRTWFSNACNPRNSLHCTCGYKDTGRRRNVEGRAITSLTCWTFSVSCMGTATQQHVPQHSETHS